MMEDHCMGIKTGFAHPFVLIMHVTSNKNTLMYWACAVEHGL